jgi:polar amino acid transport system substrate-binding protein
MLRKSLVWTWVLLSAAFAMFASAANAQTKSTWDQIFETKTLRLGVAIGEPWYFKDANSADETGGVKVGSDMWRGIGPLLGKEIADAMGVKLQIVETTWANAVAGLQSNQFDFMFILDPTPQRALSIDFSPSPVLWYPLSLLAREELKVQNWSELNDPKYRIGVSLGTAQDQFISRVLPSATITRFQDNGAVIAAFQAGRIDAGCLTAPTADIARGRLKMGQTLLPKPINAVPAGAAMRQETDVRWRNYLSTVVAYYYNTGKTQEIYDQYMKFRGLDPAKVTSIVKENWLR